MSLGVVVGANRHPFTGSCAVAGGRVMRDVRQAERDRNRDLLSPPGVSTCRGEIASLSG
jgi:hypothetical protein